MEIPEIIAKLSDIMVDVFDVDDLEVTEQTSASDIEEWDSMAHVRFMITVEREFKVRFENEEIAEIANIGELARVIQAKLKG